jgi:organic hydroperoxide reductase OsmC/OhrA
MKAHQYNLALKWTGNKGSGTSAYKAYDRAYKISIDQKPDIYGSSDPNFNGDPTRHNPEELLVASISGCHMLWYLHLCAEAGVIVTDYTDQATGTMTETANGGGHFTSITLYPVVIVADGAMIEKANQLHQKANKLCFIANSVNFPVKHEPVCRVAH